MAIGSIHPTPEHKIEAVNKLHVITLRS